ncbi:MAG TPA: DUF2306 domain-containing protein [Polyangiaceae bacterium]|nr:DUF2306 domain-containing protein [Polyangiaceae bacterium]
MRRLLAHWGTRGFLLSMLLGSALITMMSLPYFDFETLPPFVIEKLPLRFETLWLAALRIHVAAAALSFPLCLALMTRASQRRAKLHRYLGRVTGVLVLFALVPSGVVLSFDAKGGRGVTAGFLLSAAIVATSMIVGVRAARRRDLTLHARSMRHVLGQMSVAVISRAMIVGLDVVGLDPELVYVVALWLPVLASVLVVEWLSRRSNRSRKPLESSLLERMTRRESFPFALGLRVRALPRPIARDGR